MDTASSSSSANGDEAQPGTSTSAPSQELISLAMGLLAQGRRHLLVSDIPAAVETLEEACRMLSECYGETANECAEAYYYYGMALMELARQESDVLGDAVEGGANEDQSSSDEEAEAASEQREDEAGEAESLQENGEAEPKSKGKSLKATTNTKEEEATAEAPNEEEKDQNPESSDDVGNLQLAWEMLELAKLIYSRQAKDDSSAKPRLADCLLRLAEVSIESENYAAAIDDLNTCLALQTESLPSDSRCLAETRYQLGVAYTFAGQFDEALTNFQAAASVIEKRIENLKNHAGNEDPNTEVEELSSLLPDIREKINDTIDMQKEAAQTLAQMKETLIGGSSSAVTEKPSSSVSAEAGSSKAAAADISHLVRKKRKPEDSEAQDAKKARPDPSSSSGN